MKKSPLLKKHVCGNNDGECICECFVEAEAATRRDIERRTRKQYGDGKDALVIMSDDDDKPHQRPARYWIQIDLMQQESPLEVDAIARKIINATSYKNAKQKYDNLIELLNL